MSNPQRRRAALVPSLLALAALLPVAAPAVAAPPPSPWRLTDPLPVTTTASASVQLGDGDVLVVGGATSVAWATGDTLRYDAATGTWTTAAALPLAARQPAAVTLADGRVLVSGGLGIDPMGGFARADAAIYDPQGDAWTTVAPMTSSRFGHSLTLLADGTVLAAGGTSGGHLASAERYDPAADSWTPAGAMPSPHSQHTATRLPDGSVVVIGGFDAPDAPYGHATETVTRFDPAAGSWTPLTPLPQARFRHTATLLPDGGLLVAGGIDNSSSPRPTLRRDPSDGSWHQLAGALYDQGVAAPLGDGLVLFVQGGESKLLDTRDGQVASAGPAPVFRVGGAIYRLPDGDLVRVGGETLQPLVDRFTPRAHAATAPADFGEQTTGRRGATVTIPVTAAGDLPLFVRAAAIDGSDFAIVSDSCTGSVLERGESCFVGVRFTPAADGRRTATLAISAPLLDGGRQLVALSGDGVAAPAVPQRPAPAAPAPPPASGGGSRAAARRAAATPTLRCGTRRVARRVTCTGAPKTLGRGTARLSRGGIVYATGTLKNGRLTLKVRRRLFERRYTLVLNGRTSVKVVLD